MRPGLERGAIMRTTRGWAIVTVGAILTLAGCGSGGPSAVAPSHPIGNAALPSIAAVARSDGFRRPLDAAPSPDGTAIYFIASRAAAAATTTGGSGSGDPAVFAVAATGGSVTTLATGAPLAKPTGLAVATDGSRIYVADQQAILSGTRTGGAILTVPAQMPATPAVPGVLAGTQGWSPRGLDLVTQSGADVIYFTGIDPSSGAPGLFKVSASGGQVTTVAEGAPFRSPDSVVVNSQGVAYVTDQGSGTGQGEVFRVSSARVSPVVARVRLGQPAGVTLVNGDATLLVSSVDASTLSDQVLFVDLATGDTAAATKGIGVNKDSAGGLHGARHAAVLAWADTQGTVYRIGGR